MHSAPLIDPSRRWKHTVGDEHSSVLDPFEEIDAQDGDRCPPDRSSPYEDGSVPDEVLLPSISTGVIQTCHLLCLRVDPGDIRPFVGVAVEAGQTEILSRCRTGVLLRNDMIDRVRQYGEPLRKLAVFAAMLRPLLDRLSQ